MIVQPERDDTPVAFENPPPALSLVKIDKILLTVRMNTAGIWLKQKTMPEKGLNPHGERTPADFES